MFKKIRHMNRYREIAKVLVKYGFGYIVKEVGLFHLLSLPKKLTADLGTEKAKPIGIRLRLMMEELGPTFIKLGQLLSIRRDLIPGQLTKELSKLQDEVPSVSCDLIKKTIEEDFGLSCDELFADFDDDCIAAASIGQVHKATLKTGVEVVVKVRRPNIEMQVENDIEILRDLARLVEQHYSWAEHYQVQDIVDELASAIRTEMDYAQEGRNTDRIRKQFESNEYIIVPDVYWDYTTRRVITTDYIEGVKFSDLDVSPPEGFDNKTTAERLVKAFFDQVIVHGIYHGDPHPGNMFFLPDNKIALIDFGQVGHLTEEMKRNFSTLVIGLMRQDTDTILEVTKKMAIMPEQYSENKLRADIDELKDKYYDVPMSEINTGEAVADLFNVAQNHQIIIPKDYTMLGKAMMTIEGIITELDSGLSMLSLAEPYGKKLFFERMNPKNVASRLWEDLAGMGDILFHLPHQIRDSLTKFNNGQTRIEMHLPQIDNLLLKLDRVGNRLSFSVTLLAFSIVIVGLIIGATFGNSFLTHIPALTIGFVISFMMFCWLIFSILRSGRF